jgi:type I restriction enzyme M protein
MRWVHLTRSYDLNGSKKGHYTNGLTPRNPDFNRIDLISSLAASTRGFDEEIRWIEDLARFGSEALSQAQEITVRLAAHQIMEQEAEDLKSRIKATENRKDELVEAARAKISKEMAREEILARLDRLLLDAYRQYLRADQRACAAAIENLWEKYEVTLLKTQAVRDVAAAKLDEWLLGLGYV